MIPGTHHGTLFLMLRRMRAPLILLIVIFAISVLGLTIVPGFDEHGNPARMSFFHAFYFISYTATTIGFGEVPNAFSEQQRMWATMCIYMSVVGWAYTIGTLFGLFQDKNFRHALRIERFARAVRRLQEPFFLVCGYGETGSRLIRALDRMGMRVVVVEVDEIKAGELELQAYHADIPTLVADARHPEILRLAGLTNPNCRGVMALTNDDIVNLSIAIAARLLAPKLPALCRSESPETSANMASFGTSHIINPLQKFGEYLELALHAPAAFHFLEWLTGEPGITVKPHRDPPHGRWLLCGYGNFGRILTQSLRAEGVEVTVIDQGSPPDDFVGEWIRGDATCGPALRAAGVEQASGIIACVGDDVNNLSIAVTARHLRPDVFVILRQNHYSNAPLFDAFPSDLRVVSSRIVAHECLAILTTPLLVPFLEQIKHSDEAWSRSVVDRLTGRFGWNVPTIWSVRINSEHAPALFRKMMPAGPEITLEALLRDPSNRAHALECEVLYIIRTDDKAILLPESDSELRAGDQLLVVGRREARGALALTLENPNTLDYVLTGKDMPGGWVWEKLASRRAA